MNYNSTITSKINPFVKELCSLKDKKFRDEKGEYLVEGFKMVREAFAFQKPVSYLIGTESGIAELGINFPQTVIVSEEVLAKISDCVAPQGVCCVLKKEEYSAEKPQGTSILLDRVSDPGNVGTIIRTAAATGVKDIYLIGSADPFSPKAVRSSMSGIYSVRLHFIGYDDLKEVFSGVTLIAGDMNGKNVFDLAVNGDYCVAVGNEANGISENLRAAADEIASIPMTEYAESLNVGVALSVMLYTLKKGRIIG